MKYEFKKNSGTYMYKKKTIILNATDIPLTYSMKFVKIYSITKISSQISVNFYTQHFFPDSFGLFI